MSAAENYTAAEVFDFQSAEENALATIAEFKQLRAPLHREYIARQVEGVRMALDWLHDYKRNRLLLPISRAKSGIWLHVESSDADVKRAAQTMADKARLLLVDHNQRAKAGGLSRWQIIKRIEFDAYGICARAGIDRMIEKNEANEENIIAAVARMADEKFWRRKFRTQQARQLETVARELGLVNKAAGIYCSDATYWRHFGRKRKNRELLESLIAENQLGQCYTLAELADAGISNPVNRAAELITRVKGFEEWARNDRGNWAPMFYTLTAPSRFHAFDRKGRVYENWEKAGKPTPADAQAWLCNVWELVRAEIHRANIRIFGMRVAEPHHDGCPHWHIALWIPRQKLAEFNRIFTSYALAGDEQDEAAKKHRLKIVEVIDKNQKTGEPQSMVGYILKYITKNVNGVKHNGEEFEQGAISKALRVEAWASTWGIRQFQQIGGAPVTVWRELRRIELSQADSIEKAWEAADAGDWCLFTDAMGGATVARRDLPARPAYRRKQKINDYGEQVKVIWGLIAHGWIEIKTRVYEWTVRQKTRWDEWASGAAARSLDLCQ